MNLFALKNPLSPEAQSEARQAEATWRAVRREGQPAVNNPDLAAMQSLSDSTRQLFEQRDLQSAEEARACFSSTHERLMQAISASKPLPDIAEDVVSSTPAPAAPASAFAPLPKERPKSGLLTQLQHSLLRFQAPLRYGTLMAACAMALVVGRRTAHVEAPFFPVHRVVADYDGRLNAQEVDFDLQGTDARSIAAILSSEVGMRVRLPRGEKVGAKLLGVRHAEYDGIPTVEAHFDKAGTRIAYLQAKAPQHSLRFVTETRLKDRVYLVRDLGNYRVVAWRADDSVQAVVSPLGWTESLHLADSMRDTVTGDHAA